MPTIHHYSRTHRRRAVPSAMWAQAPTRAPRPPVPVGLADAIRETIAEAEMPAYQIPDLNPANLWIPSPLLPPTPDPAWPTLREILHAALEDFWTRARGRVKPHPRPAPSLAFLRGSR